MGLQIYKKFNINLKNKQTIIDVYRELNIIWEMSKLAYMALHAKTLLGIIKYPLDFYHRKSPYRHANLCHIRCAFIYDIIMYLYLFIRNNLLHILHLPIYLIQTCICHANIIGDVSLRWKTDGDQIYQTRWQNARLILLISFEMLLYWENHRH